MSKRKSQPPSPAATIVTCPPIILKQVRAALFAHIRSAILKTSQPKAAKPTPQKSMRDILAFPICFLQDTCALSRSLASNKLLRSNRRGKGIVPSTPV